MMKKVRFRLLCWLLNRSEVPGCDVWLKSDKWIHVAVTHNQDGVALYANGRNILDGTSLHEDIDSGPLMAHGKKAGVKIPPRVKDEGESFWDKEGNRKQPGMPPFPGSAWRAGIRTKEEG
jgi:hypothetical protein